MSKRQLARWRAVTVGYVFQLYNLVPVLTAYENVELPLLVQSLNRRERHERVAAALDLVGIADRPFLLAGTPTDMSFSVGVAVADEDRGGAALFQDAERAMHEVKAAAHGSWLFG